MTQAEVRHAIMCDLRQRLANYPIDSVCFDSCGYTLFIYPIRPELAELGYWSVVILYPEQDSCPIKMRIHRAKQHELDSVRMEVLLSDPECFEKLCDFVVDFMRKCGFKWSKE